MHLEAGMRGKIKHKAPGCLPLWSRGLSVNQEHSQGIKVKRAADTKEAWGGVAELNVEGRWGLNN